MVRLEITLRPDEAELVMKAIEKARDELRERALRIERPVSSDVENASQADRCGVSSETPATVTAAPALGERRHDTPTSRPQIPLPARADGLLSLAEASLRMTGLPAMTGRFDPPEGGSMQSDRALERPSDGLHSRWGGDRYRVLVHLAESLAGPEGSFEAHLEDGTRLSPEAFRRLSCQGRLISEAPPPAFAEDERPSLLALGNHGVDVPLDSEINACGWDGWAIDHAAVLDALIRSDPPFASG